MDYDLGAVIALAIYGPASILWSAYWLISRARKKRAAYKMRKARKALN